MLERKDPVYDYAKGTIEALGGGCFLGGGAVSYERGTPVRIESTQRVPGERAIRVLTSCLKKMRVCRLKAAKWRRETGLRGFQSTLTFLALSLYQT